MSEDIFEQVAERLAESMKAHRAALPPAGRKRDWEAARPMLHTAYLWRMAAHDLDPEHRAPAWQGDFPHEAMVAFYREKGADE